MALPAVLLKAKGMVKKGAAVYNAAKQAKNLTDGEELQSSLFNKLKLPIMIGGTMFVIGAIFLLIIISTPFILAESFLGNGGSKGTYSGDLAYLQWAIDIANDDSHGYSQCNRNGNPDYDCSSLVWYSLVNGSGISEDQLGGYPFTTYTQGPLLQKVGFTEHRYTGHADLQPGDILLRDGHTAIYVGDDKIVHASSPEGPGVCGMAGDQTGREIVVTVDNSGWETYYRAGGWKWKIN